MAAVRFAEIEEPLTNVGADVTVDTRRDPALPRNAVYLLAGIERLGFDGRALALPGVEGARSARRSTLDARGYLGLVGQTVLNVRGQAVLASHPLPPFERALLGGSSSLRGWDVGSAAGDNLAAVSAEVLVPLTSPLQQFAKLGVKVFADSATTWNAGERLRDQTMRWGYGGGVFLNATVFRFAVDLGWRDGRGVPNAHVQLGVRLAR
jgi:hemolysin activation/secretion protein